MSNDRIRITLADDHRVVLESFRSILESDPSFEVLGTATTAESGRDLVQRTRPDVAVFDLEFPGLHPFDVIPRLQSEGCHSHVVILTAHCSVALIHQAVKLGVRGYLMKHETADFVRDAFRRVAQGNYVFSACVEEQIAFNEQTQSYDACSSSPIVSLSLIQIAILRHLAAGRTVKEIGGLLGRSEKSIDSHKYRIMHRLGLHDRVELCRYAIREGISVL